jgi:hypothetical protein
MDLGIDISCSTCFAIPGEMCRTKYLVHGQGEIVPVLCPTHNSRLEAGERAWMKRALAEQICSVALDCLERQRGPKRK